MAKKCLIWLGRTRVRVLGGSQASYEWNGEDLVKVFEEIRKKNGSVCDVLLDDLFVYQAGVQMKEGKDISREEVSRQVAGEVPEDLEKCLWGFEMNKSTRLVGVVVVAEKYTLLIREAIEKSGMGKGRIETVARLYSQGLTGDSLRILKLADGWLEVRSKDGLVVSTRTFEKEPEEKDAKVVQVTEGELVERWARSKGVDGLVVVSANGSRNWKKWLLAGVGVIVALVIGIMVWWGVTRRVREKPVVNVPAPAEIELSVVSSPTPVVVSEVIEKNKYGLEIQNGSTLSGEAKRLGEVLSSEGYRVVGVGNATKKDYETTELRVKGGVSEDFVNRLDTDLAKIYTVDEGLPLVDSYSADVLVVIGRIKK